MKLIKSETAASEIIGHVIILGITIIGVSMITLYGVPTIYSLEDMANVKNVEQTFAVLDSRASRAVLGDSPLQITSINLGGGTLTVEPNSTSPSYIAISSTIFNFTIPMGKVKYQLGDRIVAYEGGGVWSKYPSGGSVMLSRPEFNYNGVTLTLPVFDINGNNSVGGKGTAAVSFKKPSTMVLFPNASVVNRTNPVNYSSVGKVNVTIKSDFYDAWANYVENAVASAKVVSTDPKNSTALISLTVYPAYIGQSASSIADPIEFRGLDPSNSTPLNNFSFKIKPDGSQLDWDIRTVSGTKWLFFFIKGNSLNNLGDAVTYLRIGYQDTGQGYAKPAETWEVEENFTLQSDGYVYVDLLNTSINLTYKDVDVGSDSSSSCTPSVQIKEKFNNTGPGFSWGSPLTVGGTKTLYNITQHYIQKMAQNGDFSFSQCGSHEASSGSTMYIDYYSPGGLTYLHITDNKADVAIS